MLGAERSFAQITPRDGAILSAASPGSVDLTHEMPIPGIAQTAKTNQVVARRTPLRKEQLVAFPVPAASF